MVVGVMWKKIGTGATELFSSEMFFVAVKIVWVLQFQVGTL